MNRRETIIIAVCSVFLPTPLSEPASAQERRSPNRAAEAINRYMRAKLEHAKELLERITVENVEMISKNADRMIQLSDGTLWEVYQISSTSA